MKPRPGHRRPNRISPPQNVCCPLGVQYLAYSTLRTYLYNYQVLPRASTSSSTTPQVSPSIVARHPRIHKPKASKALLHRQLASDSPSRRPASDPSPPCPRVKSQPCLSSSSSRTSTGKCCSIHVSPCHYSTFCAVATQSATYSLVHGAVSFVLRKAPGGAKHGAKCPPVCRNATPSSSLWLRRFLYPFMP